MYDYKREREGLLSFDGLRLVLKIRDNAFKHIAEAGAVNASAIMRGLGGDSWQMLSAIDFLVESGDLTEVPTDGWVQHRVFVKGR